MAQPSQTSLRCDTPAAPVGVAESVGTRRSHAAAHLKKAAYLFRKLGWREFMGRASKTITARVASNANRWIHGLTDRMPARVFQHESTALSAAPRIANHERLPSVEVVIVSYNSAHLIEACVTSVLASNYPRDRVSLVLVDNHSPDGSVSQLQRLAEKHPQVRVIANLVSHEK